MSDDYTSDTQTTGAVTVGGSTTGDIEIGRDQDWFEVTLEAGKTYRIDLKGSPSGDGTLRNPHLRGVHDEHGDLIAGTANNNGGTGRNSRVLFTPDEDGTYYIAAGGHGNRSGTYTLSVREFTDDYAAGTETTGTVTVGGPTTGDIESRADEDWFAVTLDAGKTYRIDLEGAPTRGGTLGDPYLRGVHNADGDLIAGTTNDDGGTGFNSQLFFTADDGGTYYIAAGAYGGNRGTYTLSVEEDSVPDDYAAGTETTGTVTVDDSTTGDIEFSDDQDWFAVNLEAGKTYRIDLEGSRTGDGTLRNPYLRGVHDADGVLIADTTDDDGGTSLNSQLFFTAADDGTHYVAASAYADGLGTYKLSVEEIPDDYAAGTETTGTVTVGDSTTGDIEFSGDQDWFAVNLEAGKAYQIDLRGSPTGDGTLSDPYLRGVHDANGALIAGTTSDDRVADKNSQLFFTADDTGTYYVAAGAYADHLGTYTVSVREATDDYAAGTETTGTVTVGGSKKGSTELPDDRDWFAVTLEANKTYRIDLEGWWTWEGTLFDPYLHGVHDAEGTLIAGTTNDNGGKGANSRLLFTPDDDGTYYVAAGASANAGALSNQLGTYKLSVEEITDDYAAGTETTGTVPVGGSATGNIETGGDQDWFAVTLDAGKTYQIDLEGSRTGAGTLPDPYLHGVHDAGGALIAGTTNDDGGTGFNSQLLFTADAAGTYYVAAGTYAEDLGTYTLSVEEVM